MISSTKYTKTYIVYTKIDKGPRITGKQYIYWPTLIIEGPPRYPQVVNLYISLHWTIGYLLFLAVHMSALWWGLHSLTLWCTCFRRNTPKWKIYHYIPLRSNGDIMVLSRMLLPDWPGPQKGGPYILCVNATKQKCLQWIISNVMDTFHAPWRWTLSKINNGLPKVAAIWDIVQILNMPIGTKQIEIDARLLWGAHTIYYTNFEMVTLDMTFGDICNIKMAKELPFWPNITINQLLRWIVA